MITWITKRDTVSASRFLSKVNPLNTLWITILEISTLFTIGIAYAFVLLQEHIKEAQPIPGNNQAAVKLRNANLKAVESMIRIRNTFDKLIVGFDRSGKPDDANRARAELHKLEVQFEKDFGQALKNDPKLYDDALKYHLTRKLPESPKVPEK